MADRTALRRVIREIRLFAVLDDADCDALAHHLKPRRLGTGEVLYRQGEPGDRLAVVADGLLMARVTREDGTQADVGQVMRGEVVGEMACLDPAPRSANVVALGSSLVYELSRASLRALVSSAPSVVVEVSGAAIRAATHRLRSANDRIEGILAARGAPGGGQPAPHRMASTAGYPAQRPLSASSLAVQAAQAGQQAISPLLSTVVAVSANDLGRVAALADYSAEERQILASVATGHLLEPGVLLCREAEPGRSCFLLVAGGVEVVKTVSGTERVLATLGPGQLVGQMALVDRAPRSATIRTTARTLAVELQRDAFDRLVRARSPLALRFQEQIAIAGIRQLRLATDKLALLLATMPPPRPRGTAPRREDQAKDICFAILQTAVNEWGVDASDIENAVVVRPDGIMTQAELRARTGR